MKELKVSTNSTNLWTVITAVESGEGIERSVRNKNVPHPQWSVESGEGIESINAGNIRLKAGTTVESGEGIERHSTLKFLYRYDVTVWNPVKELKAAVTPTEGPAAELNVESGEGIERSIAFFPGLPPPVCRGIR